MGNGKVKRPRAAADPPRFPLRAEQRMLNSEMTRQGGLKRLPKKRQLRKAADGAARQGRDGAEGGASSGEAYRVGCDLTRSLCRPWLPLGLALPFTLA